MTFSAETLVTRIALCLAQRQVHPSKVVVLLPYGQLLPLFTGQWARQQPDGFAPRFETTRNWAQALGAGDETLSLESDLAGDDFRFDAALDNLTARSMLERSGLGSFQDELMPRLLTACATLAHRAAAVPPPVRLDWLAQTSAALAALQAGQAQPEALKFESAVTQIALLWAASSSYATDMLFSAAALSGLDLLIVLDGLQAEPLALALAARMNQAKSAAHESESAALHLPLIEPKPVGRITRYQAQNFEEEALWATACILRQLEVRQGREPIALVATDRTLTRRIAAILHTQSLGTPITVRDETGWTLSTTRAAATVLTQLQACGWNASCDAVLDFLKNSPAYPEPVVAQLETLLRQARCSLWQGRNLSPTSPNDSRVTPQDNASFLALKAFDADLQAQLTRMQAPRSLQDWLTDFVAHLHTSGVWAPLQEDLAGQAIVRALHLGESAQARLSAWPLSGRRLRLDEFTAWVRHALEASSFVPPSTSDAQVVILPLSQLLARPFSAVVVPGCDEVRLSAAPELPGNWTSPERVALGLPSRDDAQVALQAAWQQALQIDQVDLLWRATDSGGESLLPSPLVQLLTLPESAEDGRLGAVELLTAALTPLAPSPVGRREVAINPTAAPQPRGNTLPVTRLSASAYEDLRRCPYRFFALRQLGLKEAGELDAELEKRDIGNWLHEVLKDFHLALPALVPDTTTTRRELLDHCAQEASDHRNFSPGEFLPYQAAWPGLRDPYLDWLTAHQATGAQFERAETWHETGLGPVTLVGRIDRIDSTGPSAAEAAHGGGNDDLHTKPVFLIDYKTEPPSTTKNRLKDPLEDTQLAFYAALLPHDSLRAAYLNINERDGTAAFEQEDVVHTRDALIEGILDDLQRINGGAVLAALGEGSACDYCAARGLCRKDFWTVA